MKPIALVACVTGAMAMVVGCGSSSTGNSTSQSGQTKQINVLYADSQADVAALQAVIPEYEKETGVKVNLTSLAYNNLQQKVFQELSSKSSYYDVMAIDTPWMPALTGQLQPITSNLEKDNSKVNLSDFITKVFLDTTVYNPNKPWVYPSNITAIDPQKIQAAGFEIYGLPIQSNVLTLSYRKDLFDNAANQAAFQKKYGQKLEAPKTWSDFQKVAQFFTQPQNNLWGTTLMPGVGDWATDDFKTFLASWGGNGRLMTNQLEPQLDTPEAVQAMTFYNNLINKSQVVPPGTKSGGWDEAATTFGSGKTAMSMNYSTESLASNVKGSIAYAMVPGNDVNGTLQQGPHFGTWELSVNKYSTHQDAAVQFMEWATSAKVQEEMLQEQLHPTRTSVYQFAQQDKALTDKFGNFYQVLGESLAVGVGRPRVSNYMQISNAIATAVNNIVTGNTSVDAGLKSAQQNVTQLLQQGGYQPGSQN